MTTLFISDLHLEAERPDIAAQFLEFLKTDATEADDLYILGNLFEAWVGDDDPNAHNFAIKRALRKVVDRGIPVYFMHGNRDFMIGSGFTNETGVKILKDPYKANMYGRKVLLSHGDKLCTDDVQYQKIRKMTRDPEWQAKMLAKPLKDRLRMAAEARRQSLEQTLNLSMEIMDVNQEAVVEVIRKNNVDILPTATHIGRACMRLISVTAKPSASCSVTGTSREVSFAGTVADQSSSQCRGRRFPTGARLSESETAGPAPTPTPLRWLSVLRAAHRFHRRRCRTRFLQT